MSNDIVSLGSNAMIVLLKTVFVSIPEEFYIIMFTLILMGEFDYWKEDECRKIFDKWDCFRVFLPVAASALLPNILRCTELNVNIISVISMLTALVCMILTGDIFGDATALKWIGKAAIFLLLAAFTEIVIESSYVPFIMYGAGKTIKYINDNFVLEFLCSLPARIMEYSILAVLYAKKRTILKGKIIRTIFESRWVSAFMSVLLISNVVLMIVIMQMIDYQEILSNVSFEFRTIAIICSCVFPLLNITIPCGVIYYLKNKESQKKKMINERLEILSLKVKKISEAGNQVNTVWKLNELQKDIDDLQRNFANLGNLK